MLNDKRIKNKILRRVLLVGSLKLVVFAAIIGRLYKLQVIDRDKYKTLSDKNRINLKFHAPLRGKITDSTGKIIANNKSVYSLTYSYSYIHNFESTLAKLIKLINFNDLELDIIQREIINIKMTNKNIILKEYLSWKELSIIYVNIEDLPGVNIKSSSIREYSRGSYFAHTIGYTSYIKDKNTEIGIEKKMPFFLKGQNGIEKIYDNYLKGIPGTEEIEVNAKGKFVRRLSFIKSKPGKDIQLTINSELQDYGHNVIGPNIGAVLVLNAKNGDILCSASSPSYDPNIFSKTLNTKSWNNILNSANAPLINRPIKGLYPPGSTFKPVVALAALKYGLIDSNEKIFCNGTYVLGDRNFHCWKKHGHGKLNLLNAMAQSCDTYFYDLALRLGIDKIADTAKLLGFGKYYDDYYGISKSIIPNKEWKKNNFNERWQKGETLNVGIGQGFLLSTPLELAIMTGNLINNGNIIIPNIIKSISGENLNYNKNIKKNNFNIEHLNIVKKAMYRVMNTPNGTAWKSRIDDRGFKIAGKTGTSQVRIISAKERETGIIKNEDLPFEKRDHALFTGFAPYENPKYITTVILEHAGGGASKAAPLAKKLLIKSRKIIEGLDTDPTVS
ncbi:MAG: penicillin-binding protein 2 [Pelagibacterales bacterium]|nr:penicillin-binding protein 2 [Pelagibacterales bacterium]PPR16180.1 MAG: Penicillin-binding protein 2 [Alphaproteobacteria bacterium MarineAlpha9_Bin3]|tara:strand:- start:3108 stop:4952 length:1845 start_codon:yes stop_codon:yes gene_type:complete